MTEQRTTFVARTSLGAPIRIFEERNTAMAWSDTEGHRDFPGHTISRETEVTILTARVLRRDRPDEERAA